MPWFLRYSRGGIESGGFPLGRIRPGPEGRRSGGGFASNQFRTPDNHPGRRNFRILRGVDIVGKETYMRLLKEKKAERESREPPGRAA